MTEQNNIEQKVEEIGVKYGFDKETREEVKKHFTEAGQLGRFIERIERLEEEKRNIQADIREVYSEAKGAGFSAKGIREIVKLRRLDPATRAEEEYMRDEYKKLVGITD